jgi:hypothetical protein
MNVAQQAAFRRELDRLGSWQSRSEKIEARLRQTCTALVGRNEKLLSLRSDFDALTLAFWRSFAGRLGSETPDQTIVACQARMRSPAYIVGFAAIIFAAILLCILSRENALLTVAVGVTGTAGILVMIVMPRRRLAHAREVAGILAHEQEPFWLTAGSIALSNLSTTPPPGAGWWTPERTTFVFLRHITVRWTIDACSAQVLWQDSGLWNGDNGRLHALLAAQILKDLLASDPRYRQMVGAFVELASLEDDMRYLNNLATEAQEGLVAELREAEERVTELRRMTSREAPESPPNAPQSPQAHFDGPAGERPQEAQQNGWDSLVIPTSLREKLQAYCRILRDFKQFQAVGIHLPKGLLLFGPPGTGKTQTAKVLSAEAGLNFIALSTSDCKAMFIGWSADRLAKVFKEAREKQPSLIFIDELDIVCPPRGAYHDCISQEFTGELLQKLDGISSDNDAIFLIGSTNRPDMVDAAVLSRFAEQIEFPLPDETARAALLEVFLGRMPFCGDRHGVISSLVWATDGMSGRDLRAVVTQAVLAAVKRCPSPREFSISAADFAPTSNK